MRCIVHNPYWLWTVLPLVAIRVLYIRTQAWGFRRCSFRQSGQCEGLYGVERVTGLAPRFLFLYIKKYITDSVVAKNPNCLAMAIVLRHPIAAKIEDRASFLSSLLKEYPKFLNEWENNAEKEFAQIAKDHSDGDMEVESTIYSSLCSAFNDNADKMNMFYQSVFLMCYSYYESCVAQLSRNANAKESIFAICKSKSISLSEESLEAINYLQNDINDLRNNICHNNFGTFRKTDTLKRLSELNIGFEYNDHTLTFTDSKLIIDVLDKMHMVLHELCEKLGYKTKFIGK